MRKEGKSKKEQQQRNIYLRKLLTGQIQGPLTGKPSIDKPHLKFYPEEALKQELPETTMYDYMYKLNKDHLDEIALIFDTGFDETKITYRELFENIDIVAKNLKKKGIKKNDKVALSFANTPESAYCIYALNKIGATACLIDPRITPYNLERDLKDLQAKMFIGVSESYNSLKQVKNKVGMKNIVIVPTIQSSSNKKMKNLYISSKILNGSHPLRLNKQWSNLIAKNHTVNIQPESNEKDKVAVISYTGGTTGIHKGVKLSNDAMNNMVFAHNYVMGDIERGAKFMNILPQFMIYGIFTLHLGLCRGFENHILLDSSPEHFVDNLIRINPAMAFGGPVHWETLINNPKITANCFSNMRAPVSGGEKLPLAKEKEISKALLKGGSQQKMCNGYGASELGGSVTLKEGDKNKDGTIGRLHVYDNAKVVNPKTEEELSYHESGELWISTPSIMLGYYNRDDETEKALIKDETGTTWFKTGDLAEIDENGDIQLTGRSKRLFVCGLNNVYPPEMEELIYSIPLVKQCVVVNVPDEELREVPKVHLVLNQDNEENRKKVTEMIPSLISERIGEEVLPHYYEFHDNLKHTLNGKIAYEEIRKDDLKQMKLQKPKEMIKTSNKK